MTAEELYREIEKYSPVNEQEEHDRKVILRFMADNENAFSRSNLIAHMTASAWVVNHDRTKVLLIYHRIFNSWTWTGGHADGETDLLSVAVREVKEETGVKNVFPITDEIYSLEVLTVDGHEKRGEYVTGHLHLNLTYLLEADENDELKFKEDENKGAGWFPLEDVYKVSTEPWFNERIFSKLNAKLESF